MSFNRKPSNWYSMSYDAQREWERHDRAAEDEHYARRRAEEDAEAARHDAQRAVNQARAQAAAEFQSMEEDIEAARAERDDAIEQRDSLLEACRTAQSLCDSVASALAGLCQPESDALADELAVLAMDLRAAIAKATGQA